MLLEYVPGVFTMAFKHLVQTLEPKYLELTGKPEEHTDQKENACAVHPRCECDYENCRVIDERDPWHSNSGEEDYLVGKLHREGREENVSQVLERTVKLTVVTMTDIVGVMVEFIKEEELTETISTEKGGECNKRDYGKDGLGELY